MFGLLPFEKKDNSLFNYLDDLEKQFFGDMTTDVSHFRVDVKEEDGKYVLEAELPGFSKEEIKVDLYDDTLTISAEHKEESEKKEKNYVRRERKFGSFSRSFNVSGIAVDQISASYQDGILTLDLPKMAVEEKKAVQQIEVK